MKESMDLTGQTFGRLQVLFIDHVKRQPFWKCKCICGNTTVVRQDRLRTSNKKLSTRSCGCLSRENLDNGRVVKDLTGMTFSDLFVIEKAGIEPKHRTALWRVSCVCGNERIIRTDGLTSGRIKSCGCRKSRFLKSQSKENHWNWRGGVYSGYSSEWTNELKESIRNRDSRECQFPECNYSDLGDCRKLDVHHINGIKENCDKHNLISLCHQHHMYVESHCPRDWEDYFYLVTESYI